MDQQETIGKLNELLNLEKAKNESLAVEMSKA